jgi:hypothetical protein
VFIRRFGLVSQSDVGRACRQLARSGLACRLTRPPCARSLSRTRLAVLADVVAGRRAAVLRARRATGAGPAGFRRTGRTGDLRADVPEAPPYPRWGEPARLGWPFPRAARPAASCRAEPGLSVAGDDQPGPPVPEIQRIFIAALRPRSDSAVDAGSVTLIRLTSPALRRRADQNPRRSCRLHLAAARPRPLPRRDA